MNSIKRRVSNVITGKYCLIWAGVFILTSPVAADLVPYSVQSIKVAGPGFIELVGPGKLEINDEIIDYQFTKYISVSNIDSLTTVAGPANACVVAYSSEGYSENISVIKQSCVEIIKIIASAK